MKITDLIVDAQPGEVREIVVPFAAYLQSGETLTALAGAIGLWAESPVQDANAGNLLLGSPFISGTNGVAFVGGLGTTGFKAGAVYTAIITATTSLAQTLRGGGNVSCLSQGLPSSSNSGPVPSSEFSVTSNTAAAAPGTYYVNTTSAITFTLPAGPFGGGVVLADLSGSPNVTIAGTVLNAPNGLTFATPNFAATFVWSVKYSGWVLQ